MKLAVILPAYNAENFITECLDSLLNQTFSDFCILAVNDASTDNTGKILENYAAKDARLRVYHLPQNQGEPAVMQFAMDMLNYMNVEYVARMDADDICKPNRFEVEYNWLKTHKDYDLVGSWVDEFSDDKMVVKTKRKVPEQNEEIKRYAQYRCPVNHPTVMYRKAAVLAAGGYLTEYFPEDYFLWLRMLKNGSKFYNIQDSLLWFRYSEDTVGKRGGWKYACDEVRILEKMLKMGFIPFHVFCQSVVIRFTTRVMPLPIRKRLYKLIRKT